MPDSPAPRSYRDSAVVVAGGTAGIGLASALAFVDAGVRRVAILGRDNDRGSAARTVIADRAAEVESIFIACDATKINSVTAAIDHANAALGGIDVLVNSVGSKYKPELFHRTPIDQLEDILTSQAMPPMLLTRAVLPYLTERGGGAIINVASDAAKSATPGEVVLGAAMAAIVMFTRSCAIELKRHRIRVNAVTPSLVLETNGTDWILADGFSRKLFEKAAEQATLGVPVARDLGELIAFLGGPRAAKLTGQAISLNGGISAAG